MKTIIKKRFILAFIFAIVFCIITNKTWYKTDDLPVKFDISSNGNFTINVVYNKKNDDNFKKTKGAIKTVHLKGNSKILFNAHIKHPKRMKLILIPNDNSEKIYISNIELNNKIKLDDLSKFKAKNADIKIQNNTILLDPPPQADNYSKTKPHVIELIYTEALNTHCKSHIDFLLFTTIFVLSFLVLYKLFNLGAKYKMQSKSTFDITFVLIFFIFLFIPMFHLNHDCYFQVELRSLNNFPKSFSLEFGKEFSSAFNDRFNTRKFLVPFYTNLKYKLHTKYAETNLGYVYKDSRWMFINQTKEILNDGLTPIDDETLNKITSNIKTLLNYVKKNNIKLYIVIVPTKEFIYQEEDIYHKNYEHENSYQVVKKVKKELNYDIIYPSEEFRKLKKEKTIYYKTDHHLTDEGSYELYKIITKRINKDFKDINITPLEDFKVSYNNLVRHNGERIFDRGGNLTRSYIKDDKRLLKDKYKYYDYKDLNTLQIEEHFPFGKQINPKGKYSVFIVGNSMIESLSYFLNTNYHKIVKYRFNSSIETPKRQSRMDMKGYEPFIEQEKPDILFVILSTGNILELEGLYVDMI